MGIKKKYSYKSNKTIWRILFSELNKMVIEERDSEKREVFFSCLDVPTGSAVFKSIQLEEKFWIGIETIYKDIIVFHKFGKPDMPGHKSIIAYDINSRDILWQTDEYSYQFIYDNKIYVFNNSFDNRYFYSLNIKTGEVVDNIGSDMGYINTLRNEQYNPHNSFRFLFPDIYRNELGKSDLIGPVISKYTGGKEITGHIEYILYNDIVFFNFYSRNKKKSLINEFFAVNLDSKKLFDQVLIEDANAYTADSFFIKDDLLFLLKDKNSVLAYSLG